MRVVHGRACFNSIDNIKMDALLHGLIFARKWGIVRLEVNLDVDTVIRYINSNIIPWDLRGLLWTKNNFTKLGVDTDCSLLQGS